MPRFSRPSILAAALLASLAAGAARADEFADQARSVFKKNEAAVVTVEVVLKISAGGRSRETKEELTGTVVDPSGLTVLSLYTYDPVEFSQRLQPDDTSSQLESEVSDVKILMDDGTEIPAEIVLRDKDQDLAFIRPKAKPAAPMTAVDLNKAGQAQLLDQVLTINRLNRAAGRAYAASAERISAVVPKPRVFYIPDTTMSTTSLGSPVFTLNGDLLGLVVMRAISMAGTGRTSARDNMTTIILPTGDILKAAKQAPEAKADDEKKDAPKDESKDK